MFSYWRSLSLARPVMKMFPRRWEFYWPIRHAVFLFFFKEMPLSDTQFIMCWEFWICWLLLQWIPELKHYAPGVPIVLVGTKLGKTSLWSFFFPFPFPKFYVMELIILMLHVWSLISAMLTSCCDFLLVVILIYGYLELISICKWSWLVQFLMSQIFGMISSSSLTILVLCLFLLLK